MLTRSLARLFARVGGRRPDPATVAAWSRFSNLGGTSFRRHVQSLHENGDRRNPDILAGAFMQPRERDRCLRLSPAALADLRSSPYYYYLVARTKFYDQAMLDGVARGIRRIVLIGSGHDTRLYRFGGHFAALDVDLAECDQPDAITAKQSLAAGLPHARRVAYLGIDLNTPESWEGLQSWLATNTLPTLVCAEGVSPYIETSSFLRFLEMLATRLPAGSRLAYDFKRTGVAEDFGRSGGVAAPFRLPLDEEAVVGLHARAGFAQATLTTPAALMQAFVPSWNTGVSPLFDEDAVVEAGR